MTSIKAWLVMMVIAGGLFVFSSVSHAAQRWYQSTLTWHTVPGASGYHVYYRELGAPGFTHSVRDIPGNSWSYTIGYLIPGKKYQYVITAVDAQGKEFMTTGVKRMKTVLMK